MKLEGLSPETTEVFSPLIATLSDAGRFMTDLYHGMSMGRRYTIMPGVSATAKAVGEESPVDTLLFGKDFTEKLKSAQSMEKSKKNIAKPTPGRQESKTSTSSKQVPARADTSSSLIWKGPPRKTYKNNNYRQGGQRSKQSVRSRSSRR